MSVAMFEVWKCHKWSYPTSPTGYPVGCPGDADAGGFERARAGDCAVPSGAVWIFTEGISIGFAKQPPPEGAEAVTIRQTAITCWFEQ